MARVREVGTLWIGGPLSWLEQLCLKSFVDQGQRITLFSYDDIPNVPEGVIQVDGREVLDTADFLKYEKKDSYALFADLFRLRMIATHPGMIWVDTDVYCLRPMDYESDVVMGFELAGSERVNNAVLGLPPGHPMLAAMLAFTADPFAIPPFLKRRQRAEYEEAAAAGSPIHISQQPWGTWGPLMVTHFAAAHGVLGEVQPLEAFYPIPFPDRTTFLRPARKVEKLLSPATTALHLWASNKREIGLRHMGLPPGGSYLDALCQRHDIRPAAAPIKGRGRHVFEAGLVDALGLDRVGRFADLAGHAQSLALAVHERFGAAIDLVDVDHKGRFAGTPSPWVAGYRAFLESNGVAPEAIRAVSAAEDMRPAEVMANLAGFGDTCKAAPMGPLLDQGLAPGGVLVSDIRKGSGAWPYLKERGTLAQLSSRNDGGVEIVRVILRTGPDAAQAVAAEPGRARKRGAKPAVAEPALANPARPPAVPAPPALPAASEAGSAGDWAAIAASLAGDNGFCTQNDSHSFLFIPRSPDTLVVTFDNLDIVMDKREDRRPWGFAFIEKQGWSMLGVMAGGWTWYRDPWVSAEFDRLAATGFFARFKRVVFYGASMGGYAACAFSAACPGAEVVAISPQSTLDRRIVPFETRYKVAWDRDFSGPYGDAAVVSRAAKRVTLLFDPYEPLDAGHVARFTGANVMKLRTPLLGHRLGSSLHQMGILSPIILGALNGTLTEAEFYRTLRARKGFQRYQRELFKRALDRGHPKLAQQLGRWVLTRGDNRYIRKALAAM